MATIDYEPPRAIEGLAGRISLVDSVFNLPRLHIPHSELIDNLHRAIGICRSWLGPLRRRCSTRPKSTEGPWTSVGAALTSLRSCRRNPSASEPTLAIRSHLVRLPVDAHR